MSVSFLSRLISWIRIARWLRTTGSVSEGRSGRVLSVDCRSLLGNEML